MSTYALHYYIFCICQIKWADRLVRAVSSIIVLNTTILCNHLRSHWLLKCFPGGLIQLNPPRFCHTWRVCLTLTKVVSDHQHAFISLSVLHAHLYIDQNSMLILYEKYDNDVDNFTHLCQFHVFCLQSKLIYGRKMYY